jgi:membrane protein YqaA with SNARE-associated domain
MVRRLYNWTMRFSEHRHASWALAVASFAESSFFPIPPDVLLIPMVLTQRQKAWFLAGICTLASVIGGLAGYAIGALLYDTVGLWLMKIYGYTGQAEAFHGKWNAAVLLFKSAQLVPEKLLTIVSTYAGHDIYGTTGEWLKTALGYTSPLDAFRASYAKWGAAVILIKGMLPIPYKIVTIASGFAGYNIFWFAVLSLLTRGARFYGEAWALHRYGEPVRGFIEHRLEWVLAGAAVLIIGGFVIAVYVV